MSNGIGQVHVRQSHGHMEVQGMGQTPRGQKYLKKSEVLNVAKSSDKKFKAELAAAIDKMLPQNATPTP